ncbi:unnamed protein product, partial [Aduncisulcus paluster]
IRPSTSEYSSAVTVAPKPDSPGRVCIDARTLNEYIKGNENPIPRLDDLFACKQFIGAKYFAKLDLKSAYTQIPLEEKCKHLSAFKTPVGLFEWNVLFFGIKTAPALFQARMNKILSSLIPNGVLVYLDDVIIFAKTQ